MNKKRGKETSRFFSFFYYSIFFKFFFMRHNLKKLEYAAFFFTFLSVKCPVQCEEKDQNISLLFAFLPASLSLFLSLSILCEKGYTPFVSCRTQREKKKKKRKKEKFTSSDDVGIIVFSSLMRSSKFKRVRRQTIFFTS